MRTRRMKGVLLSILLGGGVYVLWQLFWIGFYSSAEFLVVSFEVETGQWAAAALAH